MCLKSLVSSVVGSLAKIIPLSIALHLSLQLRGFFSDVEDQVTGTDPACTMLTCA